MTDRYPLQMRRALAVIVALTVVLTLPPLAERPAHAAAAQLVVDCVPSSDECWPAAFAFTPNGRELFYVERYTGEIHRVKLRTGRDTVWGEVGPVDGDGERGALGLALDPKWNKGKKPKQRKKNRWVYIFYTHETPLENRIVRLRDRRRGPGVKEVRLLTIGIDAGSNHNAGPMQFGPDNKLYVVTGDQAEPERAQDVNDPAGKVLRLNRNGSRPANNPIPGSLAFSYGHRNSFGLGFDAVTGILWQTENGPSCDDEVNLILPGGNYGWGSGSTCPDTSTEGPSPIQPEFQYTPPIVPTGIAVCRTCGLGPDVEGDVLVAFYGDGTEIRHYQLDAEGDDITDEDLLLDHSQGVLTIVRRKNGELWFSDAAGIYRLTP
jgi:glucose/arabinose dehydrogenase